MIARFPPSQGDKEPTGKGINIRPGGNVLIGENPLGTYIAGQSAGGNDFSHPFTVGVAGQTARISLGLLIANTTIIPTIGKIPLNATPNPPTLDLDASIVDELNQSWVCLEVTPHDKEKWKVEIVQRNFPVSMTGNTGRTPLALLFYKKKQPQSFQIAMFNLRYITSQPTGGVRQHYFI